MITAIILTALFVNGLQVVTNPGMIFEFYHKWAKSQFSYIKGCDVNKWHFMYKPVIGCAPCMCSIYGTAITLLTMPFTVDLIWQLPIILISSSALAKLLNSYLI